LQVIAQNTLKSQVPQPGKKIDRGIDDAALQQFSSA